MLHERIEGFCLLGFFSLLVGCNKATSELRQNILPESPPVRVSLPNDYSTSKPMVLLHEDSFDVTLENVGADLISKDDVSIYAPCCTAFEIRSIAPESIRKGEVFKVTLGLSSRNSKSGFSIEKLQFNVKCQEKSFQPVALVPVSLPPLPAVLAGDTSISLGEVIFKDLPKSFKIELTINTFPEEFVFSEISFGKDKSEPIEVKPISAKVEDKHFAKVDCIAHLVPAQYGRFSAAVDVKYKNLNIGSLNVSANIVDEWVINKTSMISVLALNDRFYPDTFTLSNLRDKVFKIDSLSCDITGISIQVDENQKIALARTDDFVDSATSGVLNFELVISEDQTEKIAFPISVLVGPSTD